MVVASPAFARANSADQAYVERTQAIALDERCGLFDMGPRLTLEGGAVLAHNALLRADWPLDTIRQLHDYGTAQAADMECASEAASTIAGQVINAYQAWRHLPSMVFPGDQRIWTARRTLGGDYAAWLVEQNVAGSAQSHAIFGLARNEDGEILPALALPGASGVRAAHLHMRDFEIAPTRVGAELRRLAVTDDATPLSAAAPPDVFTKRTWASGRQRIAEGELLAADFEEDVVIIWYPASLAEDLIALDPREVAFIDVEYAPRGGVERTERLYIEIGDFIVARYFIDMGF